MSCLLSRSEVIGYPDRYSRMVVSCSGMTNDQENSSKGQHTTESRADYGPDPSMDQFGQTLIGTRIGRYKIKRVIGSGGMGTVYEAIQEQPRRRVAIKMLKRGITSRSALHRFEFESQLLARLRHSGIAQVYEAGTHDDSDSGEGIPYFVMEYIPNAKTLTEYADHKKLDTHERLKLFGQVCDAVQHGHLKGIVHRDLKPGNILVGPSGVPQIIDFGVARSTDSDMAITTLQTDVGQLIGTLQYMSPEQVEADPADIDPRSDVYALGMILYELLTGSLPYDVGHAAIHEAVRMVREDEPSRLSTINRQLRGDVETITLKALEKNRNRRYQSALELQRDILNHLSGDPVSARRASVLYQLQRFSRKHRATAVTGGIILSISLIAVIFVAMFAIDASRERVRTKAVKQFLTNMLASVDPHLTLGSESDRIKLILAKAATDVETQFVDQPLEEAEIRNIIGKVYEGFGLFSEATPHYQQALEIRQRNLDENDPLTLKSANDLGRLLIQQGAYEQADEYCRNTLQSSRKALSNTHSVTHQAIDNLGLMMIRKGQYESAIKQYGEALELKRAALGRQHLDTVNTILGVSDSLIAMGEYDEALPEIKQAISIRRNQLGLNHPDTIACYERLGRLMQLQGNYTGAGIYNEVVCGTYISKLGTDHPATLRANHDGAGILIGAGKYREANEELRVVIDARRVVLGRDHPDTLDSMHLLSKVLRLQKKYQEAEANARTSSEGLRRRLGPNHPMTLHAMFNFGMLHMETSDYDTASSILNETLDRRIATLGDSHPDSIQSLKSMITLERLRHESLPEAGHDAAAARYQSKLDTLQFQSERASSP